MPTEQAQPGRIDPWERAKKFVKNLGDLSTSFTGCVRSLIGGGKAMPSSKFSFMSQQHLERLLKSPTVVTHLQYAALTYHKEEVEALKNYSPKQMVEVFTGPELASIITIMYLHRRLTFRCEKKDWHDLSSAMQVYLDLAVPLGQTISSIGPMRAMLAGAARYLGWGMIAAVDPKGFKKYKIGLKIKGLTHNLQEELDLWGTTHVHIAATAYQLFGIGVENANGFMQGALAKDPATLEGEELRYRVAQLWLDALIQDGSVPGESLGEDFIIADEKMDSFVSFVQALLENGSPHSWLDRRRDEITPETFPELQFDFTKVKKGKAKSNKSGADRDSEGLDDELAIEE